MLSVPPYDAADQEVMEERVLEAGDPWIGQTLSELALDHHTLIAMICRNNRNIVPDGKTTLKENDRLIIYHGNTISG